MVIVLCVIVIVMMFISVVLLFLTSLNFYKEGYSIDLTLKGLKTYFNAMSAFSWVYSATLTLLPISLTIISILHNVNSNETSALLDIRNALNQKDNIEVHDNLRGTTGKWVENKIIEAENWRKIDNYLGTLELAKILIDKGVISKDNFKRQFGYRVHNVVANKEIVHKIESEKTYWQDLLELIAIDSEWQKKYNKNK